MISGVGMGPAQVAARSGQQVRHKGLLTKATQKLADYFSEEAIDARRAARAALKKQVEKETEEIRLDTIASRKRNVARSKGDDISWEKAYAMAREITSKQT